MVGTYFKAAKYGNEVVEILCEKTYAGLDVLVDPSMITLDQNCYWVTL